MIERLKSELARSAQSILQAPKVDLYVAPDVGQLTTNQVTAVEARVENPALSVPSIDVETAFQKLDGEPISVAPFNTMKSRQLRIAMYAAKGLRDKEIAAELGLSKSTVSNTLSRTYALLGLENRYELYMLLRQKDLLQEEPLSQREVANILLLTPSELEVLYGICEYQDKSNSGIGRKLLVAEQTVKNHMSSILEKIGAGNRIQTMRFYDSAKDYGITIEKNEIDGKRTDLVLRVNTEDETGNVGPIFRIRTQALPVASVLSSVFSDIELTAEQVHSFFEPMGNFRIPEGKQQLFHAFANLGHLETFPFHSDSA